MTKDPYASYILIKWKRITTPIEVKNTADHHGFSSLAGFVRKFLTDCMDAHKKGKKITWKEEA